MDEYFNIDKWVSEFEYSEVPATVGLRPDYTEFYENFNKELENGNYIKHNYS